MNLGFVPSLIFGALQFFATKDEDVFIKINDTEDLWKRGILDKKIPLSSYTWPAYDRVQGLVLKGTHKIFYKENWLGNKRQRFVARNSNGSIDNVLAFRLN